MNNTESNSSAVMKRFFFLFFILIFLQSQGFSQLDRRSKLNKGEDEEQAISLLGKALYKPQFSAEVKSRLEADYNKALQEFRANPGNPDAHIWLGRRLAYLGDYKKAIRAFSDGAYYFPKDARFLRHRGHRFISIRNFDLALEDFEKAAVMIEGTKDQVEPDGAPNEAGIPVSSLHSNIWYHLGLTYYLMGNMEAAFNAYERCYKESNNNDKIVSSAYWLYIISKRLKKDKYADELLQAIKNKIKLLENFAYHEMLMFYKSGKSPKDHGLNLGEIMLDPTRAYGLGVWYLWQGDQAKAEDIFNAILELPSWASFGYIAAEAEIAGKKN